MSAVWNIPNSTLPTGASVGMRVLSLADMPAGYGPSMERLVRGSEYVLPSGVARHLAAFGLVTLMEAPDGRWLGRAWRNVRSALGSPAVVPEESEPAG